MTSVLNVDTIANKAGTGPVGLTKQTVAKAFYIFDGTAGTPTFGDSFNCSTLTDVATGNFTPNWTNVMGSVNYSHTTNSENLSALNASSTHLTGSSRLFVINDSGSAQDRAITNGCTHGDLA